MLVEYRLLVFLRKLQNRFPVRGGSILVSLLIIIREVAADLLPHCAESLLYFEMEVGFPVTELLEAIAVGKVDVVLRKDIHNVYALLS